MILKEVYGRVKLSAPDVSQAVFISHFDTTARALIARYKKSYVILPRAVYDIPVGINDEVPIYEEYFGAIVNNILYLVTGNPDRKTDYVAEAEDAFKAVWREKLKGTQFRDADYPLYTGNVRL